ncbi:unnamed protein product, partial [Callosobruchus maculatus]
MRHVQSIILFKSMLKDWIASIPRYQVHQYIDREEAPSKGAAHAGVATHAHSPLCTPVAAARGRTPMADVPTQTPWRQSTQLYRSTRTQKTTIRNTGCPSIIITTHCLSYDYHEVTRYYGLCSAVKYAMTASRSVKTL